MAGTVTRADKFGEPTETKPRIIFTDVIPEQESVPEEQQPPLFLDDDS
jgi:hypothetical protein